jgi:hypothetical protein
MQGDEKRVGTYSRPLREYLLQPTSERKPRANLQDAPRPETSWAPVPEVERPLSALVQFALSVTEGRPVQAPPEYALRDIETWNAMVLSHFRHKPVQIPLDRGEYETLREELVAGEHDLHWS